jgi:hypothetical protein
LIVNPNFLAILERRRGRVTGCSSTLFALAEIANQRGSSCPFLCRVDIFLHFYPEKNVFFKNLGCTAYLKYAIFCVFMHCAEVPTREVTGMVREHKHLTQQ